MASLQGGNPGTGKTVLITGASSGFGAHMAHAFAHAGYAVVLHGRDEKKLHAIQEAISEKGGVRCTTVAADLQTAGGLDAVRSSLGAQGVNVLINNAAINPELSGGSTMGDLKEIDAIISTNTSAAIALCYGAFGHFAANGGGSIININSVAGVRGSSHEPIYAASKFGLRGFSESIKDAWLKQGVRMIDVYSGAIAAGMSSKRSDVNTLMDPRELATFVVSLCATDSFFVRELNVYKTHL